MQCRKVVGICSTHCWGIFGVDENLFEGLWECVWYVLEGLLVSLGMCLEDCWNELGCVEVELLRIMKKPPR